MRIARPPVGARAGRRTVASPPQGLSEHAVPRRDRAACCTGGSASSPSSPCCRSILFFLRSVLAEPTTAPPSARSPWPCTPALTLLPGRPGRRAMVARRRYSLNALAQVELVAVPARWRPSSPACSSTPSSDPSLFGLAACDPDFEVDPRLDRRPPPCRWFFLIVIYGVFIPNTWRRCAVLSRPRRALAAGPDAAGARCGTGTWAGTCGTASSTWRILDGHRPSPWPSSARTASRCCSSRRSRPQQLGQYRLQEARRRRHGGRLPGRAPPAAPARAPSS